MRYEELLAENARTVKAYVREQEERVRERQEMAGRLAEKVGALARAEEEVGRLAKQVVLVEGRLEALMKDAEK